MNCPVLKNFILFALHGTVHFDRQILVEVLWVVGGMNVGLSGGLLALASSSLLGLGLDIRHFFLAFGYLFAMHNLNRFTDVNAQKFSDPLRALFYEKYRWPLLVTSSLSLALALTLVFEQ